MKQISVLEVIIQVSTIAIALAAWMVAYVQLKRSRRQSNEDILYHQKLEAYRDLMKDSFNFLQEITSIFDEVSNFEGTEEEWEKHRFPKIFKAFSARIDEMDLRLKHYSIFLPEKFVRLFEHFLFTSLRFLTEGCGFGFLDGDEHYNNLTEIHNALLNKARKDLHIKTLSKKLNYRLQG